MREINCRDIGMDCDFVARGNTEEEVIEECRRHGKQAHGMQSMPKDVEEKIRRNMRDFSEPAPMYP